MVTTTDLITISLLYYLIFMEMRWTSIFFLSHWLVIVCACGLTYSCSCAEGQFSVLVIDYHNVASFKKKCIWFTWVDKYEAI